MQEAFFYITRLALTTHGCYFAVVVIMRRREILRLLDYVESHHLNGDRVIIFYSGVVLLDGGQQRWRTASIRNLRKYLLAKLCRIWRYEAGEDGKPPEVVL